MKKETHKREELIQTSDNAPIGIFDSGLGGLTVARELAAKLPDEHLIYVGDTARCPYGPRDPHELRQYVLEIGRFLETRGVKLMVIACNTAAASGLELAQQTFVLPVLGVIVPGARAAVRATRNRRVAVIGTQGTIDSAAYQQALHLLDAGLSVYSQVTPEFVGIVEAGLEQEAAGLDLTMSDDFQQLAAAHFAPFKQAGVDVLVLGCTHYPVLAAPIAQAIGEGVTLISSAAEIAREVKGTLKRRGQLAEPVVNGQAPPHEFYTTGDPQTFRRRGTRIFGADLGEVRVLTL